MTDQWQKLWRAKWATDPGNDGQLYGDDGYDDIADLVSFYVTPCNSVLEVGCGTGGVLKRIPSPHRVGLDIYDRPECSEFDYVKGEATSLPFLDGSVDAAYIHGVAQFLDAEEILLAIAEMERVARFAVAILDIADSKHAEELRLHRNKIRPGLPPHRTHSRDVFTSRGYLVGDVSLPLTIGHQFKFNAVKIK
jgi:SAM-dependent methyltransferase